jgi:pentatricopeptide repeat protein
VRTYNTIITACNKSSRPEEGLAIYERMVRAGVKPTATTYTALISAYGKQGKVEQAMGIFADMVARGCERNVITYSSLIRWGWGGGARGRWQGEGVSPGPGRALCVRADVKPTTAAETELPARQRRRHAEAGALPFDCRHPRAPRARPRKPRARRNEALQNRTE